MSTKEEATVTYATLIRGRCYFLRDREFVTGVAQIVSDEDRDWLKEHAVDEVTVEGEGEHQKRPKFKFEVAREGDKPEPPSSPRVRSR